MPDEAKRSPNWGGARPGAGRRKVSPTPAPAARPTAPARPKQPGALDYGLLARMMPEILEASQRHARTVQRTPERSPFQIPTFPPKALPPENMRMAMDENLTWAGGAWGAGAVMNAYAAEGMLFPGYTYLSELAQRPEYRTISETIADDATRKWIDFDVTGSKEELEQRQAEDAEDPEGIPDRRQKRVVQKGKAEKIKAIKDEMARLKLRDHFYAMCRDDGFFGRIHLFLNFGDDIETGSQELKVPIGDGRDNMSRGKVGKRKPLLSVKVIEPVWTYPTTYNARSPLREDFYNPQVWYVMGTEIHATRLLKLVSRPVPDILKPAYSFGGLSLSQIAQPYVDIWLRTRQSVADIIHSFSVMVLMTDMQTILQPGHSAALMLRAQLFNALRDNNGLFVVNKATEDFKNVSASLAGLDHLQAQSQEHVASIARIPLVKYTGLQPTGLNASSEGEIRVYYDTITAYQNRSIRPNLSIVLNFIQLSLFGAIDPELTFEFEPLWDMSPKEQADLEKAQAERDEKYVNMGAIGPDEVREQIINNPKLPYADLDPDDVPEPPQPPGGEGGDPFGGEPGAKKPPAAEGGGAEDLAPFGLATDEFNESDVKRDAGGKFSTTGGGGGAAKKTPLKPLNLTKTGPKMGSNDGGTFKDKTSGKEFYIKKPQSKAHVTNELIGAGLYKLAGGNTLDYVPVEGGAHVATELAKLDVNNVNKFSPAEKKQAQKDFAIQAWLGNYDAAGTGGDNIGIVNGKPTALDFGGSLEYRAQGAPKTDFGNTVSELTTMLDPAVSPDNAKLYGSMTQGEKILSAKKVTDLSNDEIITAIKESGGTAKLADKLIARKQDIADAFNLTTDTSEWDHSKHPRNPDGTFAKGTGGEEPAAPEAPAEDPDAEPGEKAAGEIKSPLITKGKDDAETHALTLNKAIYAPAIAGSNYRRLLVKLIKESKQYGTEDMTGILKNKLIASLGKTRANTTKKAQESTDEKEKEKLFAQSDKLLAKMEELGYKFGEAIEGVEPTNPAEIANAQAAAKAKKAEPAPSPAKLAPSAPKPDKAAEKAQQAVADLKNKVKDKFTSNIASSGKNISEPLVKAKEIIKAAVQSGAPLDVAEAVLGTEVEKAALVKQYGSVENAYAKALSYHAQATQNEALAKQAAEAAAAAEKKAAVEAKAKADKAAQTEAEKEAKRLAKHPDEKVHYDAIKAITGGGKSSKQYLAAAESRLKSSGYGKYLKPEEAVSIIAYSGSHYGQLNQQLRAGVMSPGQYAFMKSLNASLDKLPEHKSTTYRKASLTPDQAKLYQKGMIVEERGFTSSSKNQGTWSGSHYYTIHGKKGRDIQKLSSHSGEAEVLFKAGSRFIVEDVKGNEIVLREVD